MALRHMLLAISAVAVLGMGIYLAIEVTRTTDAVPVVAPVAVTEPEPTDEPKDDPTPSPGTRARTPKIPGTKAVERVRARNTTDPPTAAAMERVAPIIAADAELNELMAAANKAYDKGNLDDARTAAGKVLAQSPDNVRMLRVMVSASCILGESTEAQTHFARLPGPDQEQMRTRCERYGVSFK